MWAGEEEHSMEMTHHWASRSFYHWNWMEISACVVTSNSCCCCIVLCCVVLCCVVFVVLGCVVLCFVVLCTTHYYKALFKHLCQSQLQLKASRLVGSLGSLLRKGSCNPLYSDINPQFQNFYFHFYEGFYNLGCEVGVNERCTSTISSFITTKHLTADT